VSLLCGRAGARSGPGLARPAAGGVYVVRRGDTVWGIAASIAGPAGDPRPVVDRLVRVNGVRGGVILPGQELRLGP